MRTVRRMVAGCWMALAFGIVFARTPARALTADAIMKQVAANQDKAEAERPHYVYVQHARVVSRKGDRVMCEEVTDSRMTPSVSGSHVELLKLDGRVWREHKYVTYHSLPAAMSEPDPDAVTVNISDDDRELVESLRADLTRDRSRDGINGKLFPLTSKNQSDYLFHLAGRERLNGRDVWHVEFRPKDRSEYDWKGDAWVDTAAYQPVVVSTGMSRKVPFAVRTMLGTNVPGLGFTVVYAEQPDGVWFPVSFGTEFKIKVLFFFSREIVVDMRNREFEKTHVSAQIVGGGVQP